MTPPSTNKTYNEIKDLMEEIREQGRYETRLTLLEKDMENYVKETDIHKMIAAKIQRHIENEEKMDKKTIQWGSHIEKLVVMAIGCLITYFILKGVKS